MAPDSYKIIAAVLIVLLIIYAVLRRRTEKIRKDRNVRSMFRRDR